MMKTPTKQPVARGGVLLSEGAKNVPGSSRYRALQKAPYPGSVEIGKDFASSPKGGPELVIGKRHIHVKGDPKHPPR
jgi:hypothetical protein